MLLCDVELTFKIYVTLVNQSMWFCIPTNKLMLTTYVQYINKSATPTSTTTTTYKLIYIFNFESLKSNGINQFVEALFNQVNYYIDVIVGRC